MEAAAQQRNIAFPDTVENEGESYRAIATRPLTRRGKIGFSVLPATVAILIFMGDQRSRRHLNAILLRPPD